MVRKQEKQLMQEMQELLLMQEEKVQELNKRLLLLLHLKMHLPRCKVEKSSMFLHLRCEVEKISSMCLFLDENKQIQSENQLV